MSDLKKLPLHKYHISNGAKFTDFAGWEMPVSYGSSLNEHKTVRKAAGLFDVSHMGEIEIEGEQAAEFLNEALSNDIKKCEVGQGQYSLICLDDGGTLDDLILYRLSSQKFFLCVNAANKDSDVEVLKERATNFDCSVRDRTCEFGQLALQGPDAAKVISNVIGEDISHLRKMHFIEGNWMGSYSILARTGYTGEDGFEIYCSTLEMYRWVNDLEKMKIPWVGLAARDSLRLEAGFPLYGHELSKSISPVKAGLSWAVGWDKLRFHGLKALMNEKEIGPSHRVVHYLANDRRIPREGCQILDPKDESVGVVLSGGFSPLLQVPMGSALIPSVHWKARKENGWHALLRNNKIPIQFGFPALRQARMNY